MCLGITSKEVRQRHRGQRELMSLTYGDMKCLEMCVDALVTQYPFPSPKHLPDIDGAHVHVSLIT